MHLFEWIDSREIQPDPGTQPQISTPLHKTQQYTLTTAHVRYTYNIIIQFAVYKCAFYPYDTQYIAMHTHVILIN